jgi:hypothetical protein
VDVPIGFSGGRRHPLRSAAGALTASGATSWHGFAKAILEDATRYALLPATLASNQAYPERRVSVAGRTAQEFPSCSGPDKQAIWHRAPRLEAGARALYRRNENGRAMPAAHEAILTALLRAPGCIHVGYISGNSATLDTCALPQVINPRVNHDLRAKKQNR